MQNTTKSLEISEKGTITITGMLLYVQVQKPVKAYLKPGTVPKPDEWKASVVITDEDFMDELENKAKEWDAKLSVKKVKSADFEAAYKVAPPEDAGKNVWVLTSRQPTIHKSGKPVDEKFYPRVYKQVGKARIDVTQTELPANGSIGALSIGMFQMTNGGMRMTLKNVLVTDMIEYVPTEGNYAEGGSEFDIAGDEFGQAVKAETKPAAKAVVKKVRPVVAEDDTDLPF